MIGEGHGPLANILDNYTLAHINHLLPEIDRNRRRRFKEAIIASRVSQADDKHYRDYMAKLKQSERVVNKEVERHHGGHLPMSYEEQVRLEQQHHVRFNEMSVEQREKLTAEREALWGQIPLHLQKKARKLAGR